jgi:hypothetical protein
LILTVRTTGILYEDEDIKIKIDEAYWAMLFEKLK